MKYIVQCKYCGHSREWKLEELQAQNGDIATLQDALDYDQEYQCERCLCFVRINEALRSETMEEMNL